MFNQHKRAIAGVLICLMATMPSWSFAQEPGGQAKPIPLSFVTTDAALAIVVRPRRVLTHPRMEMLPTEIITAAGKQHVGVDPLDIEEVLAVVEPPVQGPPGYGVVLRFSKPYDLTKIIFPPDLPLAEAELGNRPYFQSQHPMMPGFYMPDDTTLIIAPDQFLQKMLANQAEPIEGELGRLLAKAGDSPDLLVVGLLESVRPLLAQALAQGASELPPAFQDVQRIHELIDAVKIEARMIKSPGASLALLSPNENAAENLDQLINKLLDTGQEILLSEVTSELDGDDPIQQATAQYSQRIAKKMLDILRPERKGRVLTIAHETDNQMQIATIGVLVALLLPAVQAAREAARRMQSSNHMRQIAIAMHTYHGEHGTFPPRATYDDDGKPLLSWRVHLLPYLDQGQLYEQFHLDEPWNSEHNRKLLDQMPALYRNPSATSEPNKASYLVPVGDGTIFETTEGTSLAKITDGSSNTILVLEVNNEASTIWTKPDDLTIDPEDPLAGLGTAHPGGFQAALADGSVQFIPATLDPETFRRLLMMADGKPVRIE